MDKNSQTSKQRNKEKFYRLYYSLRNITKTVCTAKTKQQVEIIIKEVLEKLVKESNNLLVLENENIAIKLPHIREFKYKNGKISIGIFMDFVL